MAVDTTRVRRYLRAFDLETMFIEELGWDYHRAQPLEIDIDGATYRLDSIAQKRGMVAFTCQSKPEGHIPSYAIRRRIDRQVGKYAHEHIIIFFDAAKTTQIWQWVKREYGKPVACREHVYNTGQPGDALIQKLDRLTFDLSEEEGLTIIDVAKRARQAFDVERVTKRFYERFKAEHAVFLGFVNGIPVKSDREWYTSLMLNRLMFIYFIQKKGFLDGDVDYLRNRLRIMQVRKGKDEFLSFYRHFLLRLFHEGLGQRQESRSPDLDALLGNVPFLNGGIFDVHELERVNSNIQIPDEAFEGLFDFFDSYQWHLDDRPLRADNEINPDVLGYIFEKYINQKEMGAYYTREDITEYISKSTVIPYIFDNVEKMYPDLFVKNGPIGQLLRDDPDRYIYDAVLKGIDAELPKNIAEGVKDLSRCQEENQPTGTGITLPAESWREYVARRTRCLALRERLGAGEIYTINDLITYNIDIRQFAQDVIETCEDPKLLWAFYETIRRVTILDPTCGSGAFLFAALNILEPLYEACLDRMQSLVDDPGRAMENRFPKETSDLRAALQHAAQHPNRRYFILKTIIINNLYGVDIMEEAVEICKLRLFLKLVAHVEPTKSMEPLPDIDFNIRAGNTLVGFVNYDEIKKAILGEQQGKLDLGDDLFRIDDNSRETDDAFRRFQELQTVHDADPSKLADAKADLRSRLDLLRNELDRYLASHYGIDQHSLPKPREYGKRLSRWQEQNRPFHWYCEFYGVIKDGGFDVIVGNPPYVSVRKVDYLLQEAMTSKFTDIYAHIVLRSLRLSSRFGRLGMIVPLSVTFSEAFGKLREALCRSGTAWFSSYDNIPAALFTGVSQRCTIWIGARSPDTHTYVSPMYRWRAAYRESLLPNVSYTEVDSSHCDTFGIPKLADDVTKHILKNIKTLTGRSCVRFVPEDRRKGAPLGYSQVCRNFISVFLQDPPCLDAHSLKELPPSKVGYIFLQNKDVAAAALASLAGEMYFWYWLTRGDGFDVTKWIVSDFLVMLNSVPASFFDLLARLGHQLHKRRFEALVFKKNAGRYVGNFNYSPLFPITRRADLLLLASLSLGRKEAVALFDYVQRVLSINEYAGEKGIPEKLKRRFPPQPVDECSQNSLFTAVDRILTQYYGLTQQELDSIVDDCALSWTS